MLSRDEVAALNDRFIDEVMNKHNVDYILDAVDDSFVEHQVMPGVTPDKKGLMEAMSAMIAGAPDLQGEVLDSIVSGNTVAARARFWGTDTDGFMPPAPATGKPFSFEGIDITTFNDEGKAIEHRGLFDVMGMMGQLGLLPPPP